MSENRRRSSGLYAKLFYFPFQLLKFLRIANKGFWADLLGVGDFYYELAVRIIQFCITEKRTTGAGIIGMQEILKKLNVAKNNREPVSEQDVEQAVKSIKIFGGFQVLVIQENGGSSNETPKKFIQSIPRELNQDIMTVFAATTVIPDP